MNNKNFNGINEVKNYRRWSIRKIGSRVGSIVVASGFFILLGSGSFAHASEENTVDANKTIQVEKEKNRDKVEESSKSDVLENKEVEKEVQTELSENKVEVSDLVKEAKVASGSVSEEKTTTKEEVNQALTNNLKETTEVKSEYLDKAKAPGPFTAGVNQVIPLEAFGGDGMLTRLILNSSDKAPWSDNGVDKNKALLPLEGLTTGKYFYKVAFDGDAIGKQGQELIDQLRKTGTHTYKAMVNIYADKDGKELVATRTIMIKINSNENIISSHESSDNMMDNGMPTNNKHMMNNNMASNNEMESTKHMISDNMGTNVNMMDNTMSNMTSNMSMNNIMSKKLSSTGLAVNNTNTILGFISLLLSSILILLGLKIKNN